MNKSSHEEVAQTVAERLVSVADELLSMGLHPEAVALGYEIAAARVLDNVRKGSVANDDGPDAA